jgi:hypothetical protein
VTSRRSSQAGGIAPMVFQGRGRSQLPLERSLV